MYVLAAVLAANYHHYKGSTSWP